mmetsp:Transcript_39882/g.86343  ORF Transcript_39882/g.86343 Transcript_39882/m.86343 type:complete len:114 (+) Transcript_39882:78-419(+)
MGAHAVRGRMAVDCRERGQHDQHDQVCGAGCDEHTDSWSLGQRQQLATRGGHEADCHVAAATETMTCCRHTLSARSHKVNETGYCAGEYTNGQREATGFECDLGHSNPCIMYL